MKGVRLLAATIVAVANSSARTLATPTSEGGAIENFREDGAARRRRRLADSRPETGTRAAAEEEEQSDHREHRPTAATSEPTTASGAKPSMRTHAPHTTTDYDESTTTVAMSMSISSRLQHEGNDESSGKSGKSKSDKSSKKINDNGVTTSSPSSSHATDGSGSNRPTCTGPTDGNCIVPVPVPIIDGGPTVEPGMISFTSSPDDDGMDGGVVIIAPPSSPVPSTSTATTTTAVPPRIPTSTTSYPSSYSKSPTSSTSSTSTTTATATKATTTLTWKGVNGCTPLTPCQPCAGDCDTDADCASGASIAATTTLSEGGEGTTTVGVVTQYAGACYKRSDGGTERIPGCHMGGMGDVPGADYCYARAMMDLTYHDPPPYDDDDVVVDGGGDGNGNDGTPPPTNNNSPSPHIMTSLSPAAASVNVNERVSPRPSIKYEKNNDGPYYFIQSRIEGGGGGSTSSGGGWCIGGALSPDYYQLVMEECTATIDDYYYTNKTTSPGTTGVNGLSWDDAYVTTRLEQMDQLWHMDTMGYIRSAFDYDRCMTVPMSSIIEQQQQQQQNNNNDDVVDGDSGGLIANESPVEIGPCIGTTTTATTTLSRFIYPKNANEFVNGAVPKLRLRGFENYCITFLGFDGGNGIVPKGAPVVLGHCPESVTVTGQDEDGSYGWDFVSERNLGVDGSETGTTAAPTSVPLPLRYLGRDACSPVTPCHECMGDCDTDDDCSSGLTCFEREKDEYTKVPGCGTGGPGDIPGADYCYDSTPDNSDVGDNGLDPSTPPLLRWLGSEGCSPSRPCGACSGDCDEDDDCIDSHECFKRYVGETIAVPGCAVGGLGDIPGGDYCYDTGASVPTTGSSSSSSSFTSDGPESTLPTPKTRPPRPAPSAPFNAIVNGINTQATGGDDVVVEERIRQPALTRHNIMHDSAKTHKEKDEQ